MCQSSWLPDVARSEATGPSRSHPPRTIASSLRWHSHGPSHPPTRPHPRHHHTHLHYHHHDPQDVSSSGRYVAVGGEGHQLKVWDLEAAGKAAKASSSSSGAGADGADGAVAKAGEPLFAGKAGKPSRSGLQDLAHVTAVAFVPGQDDKQVRAMRRRGRGGGAKPGPGWVGVAGCKDW